MTEDQQKTMIGAVAVVAIGLGLLWYTNGRSEKASCAMTGVGVTVLAAELSRGHSQSQVLAALAGLAAGSGCANAVDTFVTDPTETVPIDVGGEEIDVSGSDLDFNFNVSTPTCADWISLDTRARCTLGLIDPPPVWLVSG